jgi:serine-type D-Ala-D-Ala carboxypeptidase/endopeptidase
MLDRYVGRYSLPRSSILRIARDGARLLAQLDEQKAIEVFAASDTEFFGKAVPARIEFVVTDAGEATGLVLHQGGRAVHAPRIDGA